jgi:phosphoglycerate dehydrogenase-like enzyme
MLIWVAERPERDALVLPEGVEAVPVPRRPASDPDLARVEVLVPPYRSRSVLEALPGMSSLRLVQALESGVEWLIPHVPDGVPLCNSRGAHDAAVAEWVVGVVLAMQRRLPDHLQAQHRAQWRDVVARGEWRPPYAGDLEGSTVLIVGYGSIGAALERRLEPFEVELSRVARRERPGVHPVAALLELIPRADVVVLLVPLTAATEGMIDAASLRAMKPGALLVNAGRGRLVDREALTEALYEERIRAAIDVTDPEPLPAEDRLWRAPNLLLTPHMAGDTPRRYRRSWQFVGEQVGRLLEGEPPMNVVPRIA